MFPHWRLSLLVALLLALPTAAQEVVFRQSKKLVRKLTLAELRRALPEVTVPVYEPHESRKRSYRGFALADVVKLAYGRAPRTEEALAIMCRDGYAPVIPSGMLNVHRGYLVHASADGLPFSVKMPPARKAELGPFYLVWDNLGDKSLDPKDSNCWPFQVVSLDLLIPHYPRLLPPPGSSQTVQRGFKACHYYCLTCHSLNGEGGRSAPDLNLPQSVTEKYSDDWLRQYVEKPARLRPQATMPPITLRENRTQVIAEILAYLKAMAGPPKSSR